MEQHPTIELLESLNSSVIYLLESATCLAILFLLYHFFLRKEKSFHYNRAYLLVALILSVSFPLMELNYNPASTPAFFNSIHQLGNGVSSEPIIEAEKAYSYTITANSERPFLLWWEALLALYITGVVIGLLKFLVRIRQFKEVIWYRRHSTRYKKNFFLVKTEGMMPTFSFFNYLFWDNSEQYSEEDENQILSHERAHIDQKHSYDIVLVEILKIFFWFNPFYYLFKVLLEEVHEFAADHAVIKNENPVVYSTLLVRTVFTKMGLEYGSYFGRNKTLKRLDMIKKVARTNYLKLLLPLPFIFLLFFIFSFDAMPTDEVEVKNYTVESIKAEKLPEPLVGRESWKNSLEESIIYPSAAKKADIEGEMKISFDVNPSGLIENLEFDQKLGFDTEKAIINALERSSKWKPAIQNGQALKTKIEVPILFKRS